MVMRKDLSAIVGRHSNRSSDSAMVAPAVVRGEGRLTRALTSRVMRGALPNNTSIGILTGVADGSGWPPRGGAAFALAQSGEGRRAARRQGQHVPLLRFVAPDLHGREFRFGARNLAQ